MIKLPIYYDYMATTPVDPRVVKAMVGCLDNQGIFANSASITHSYGIKALEVVDNARVDIAKTIGAESSEIIFTSGATEANNLAILGAANFYQAKGKHIITLATEHKSVIDSFRYLEKNGFRVDFLVPEANGLINLQTLEDAIRPETILVSVMHVNNEIGVIQDIAAIGALVRKKGIIFHVDAAQSAGKLAIDLQTLPIDLMSFSAHKNYGPKGIGALFVRSKPRIRLQTHSFGGNQELGLRSGTLATHQIVGMATAFKLAESLRLEEQKRLLNLRNTLWQGIKHLPGIQLNGDENKRVAGNLNLSFPGINPESLLFGLKDLAISTSSACMAASTQPSYVLQALGLSNDLAYSSIRICLGRFTSSEEVDYAVDVINKQINRLYQMQGL